MADTSSAGATPVVAGATPTQNPPAQPATGDQSSSGSATDYPEGLGDAGKRAIDAMKADLKSAKDRAAAAERERDDLRTKTLTDQERAVAEAKREGATEVTSKFTAAIRRSEVRAALTAAGINAGVLDLATRADEFGALKVSDEGEVEGLTAAIEAFKRKMPDLFKPAVKPTGFDGGPRGATATGSSMNDFIRRAARGN